MVLQTTMNSRAIFCGASIILHARGGKFCIKGRNLNAEARPEVRLFQGIARQRVAWVQEPDRPGNLNTSDRATVVEDTVR